MSTVTLRRRLVAAVGLAAAMIVGGAGTASAHVSVDAGGARQGADDAVLAFRVPNERTGARTVQVDIKLPTRAPLGSVKPAAKPGWAVTTKRVTYSPPVTTADGMITEGVGEIVYRAVSPESGIPEGGFDSFEVLVGPLPRGVSMLAFPTVQTYSNGDVSAWIEPTVPGSEPSHPAPVLVLPPPDDASASPGPASDGAQLATRDEVRTARWLGLVGVVTGSLGLLAAGLAVARSRRPARDSERGEQPK
jgi:uncharacterized protein YcnI